MVDDEGCDGRENWNKIERVPVEHQKYQIRTEFILVNQISKYS